tara:strand:+ start:344 stop:691 length:348 start_codon:yes stop_codon:yes gene_type:complete
MFDFDNDELQLEARRMRSPEIYGLPTGIWRGRVKLIRHEDFNPYLSSLVEQCGGKVIVRHGHSNPYELTCSLEDFNPRRIEGYDYTIDWISIFSILGCLLGLGISVYGLTLAFSS